MSVIIAYSNGCRVEFKKEFAAVCFQAGGREQLSEGTVRKETPTLNRTQVW